MLRFFIRLLSVSSLTLVIASGSQAYGAPLYELTDLGALGGRFSLANAINDAGQVVGLAETASGRGHATLFNTRGGANLDLGTLGGNSSEAAAINNDGQIVGMASTAGGKSHATLFNTRGGANLDLGTLGGEES